MNSIIAIALLIAGVVLLIFGFSSAHSAANHASNFFTGSPTDKTLWLMIGGTVCAAIGLVGVVRGSKSNA
jgi:glycerol dehydrogenase-like iron-containing ADH family enzyme